MSRTKAHIHYSFILGRVLCALRRASGVSYTSPLASAAFGCKPEGAQTAVHRAESGRTTVTVLRLARMHQYGLTFGWAPDNILWAVSQVVERLEAEGVGVVYDSRGESSPSAESGELFITHVNRQVIDHVVSRVLFDSAEETEEEAAPTTNGESGE